MEYEMANFVPYSGGREFLFSMLWMSGPREITWSRIKVGTRLSAAVKEALKKWKYPLPMPYNAEHFVRNNWTAYFCSGSPWMKLPSVRWLYGSTPPPDQSYQEKQSTLIISKSMIIPLGPKEFWTSHWHWRLAMWFFFQTRTIPGQR